MSEQFGSSILDESNTYQKLRPTNAPDQPSDQENQQNTVEYTLSIKSDELSSEFQSLSACESDIHSSSVDLKSTETTKSELIQRILDSFKTSLYVKSSSDNNTTNTSLLSIDQTIISCQSNQIYLDFKTKNELGLEAQIDELLEKIAYTNKCSCHRIEINFHDQTLNQQLSYKQKQAILRIILRRQQIFDRYFS